MVYSESISRIFVRWFGGFEHRDKSYWVDKNIVISDINQRHEGRAGVGAGGLCAPRGHPRGQQQGLQERPIRWRREIQGIR